MNYSELISFLKEINATPKRSLSQNFLIDTNVVKKIIQTADVQPGDIILEIGPGPGALTKELLKIGAIVHAIEMDTAFATALSRFQTPDKRLTVYCADALEFPLRQIPFQKVVANLPYHITTPLLERFFHCEFISLTLMVQKEFAERIFAPSGTKEFGSLTLFTQFYTTLKSSFTVPPSCFYPKPSIDSSVIHLHSHPKRLDVSDLFFPVMRRAFQQRRKMLSTSLQDFASLKDIKESLNALSLREDARPEMLSLEKWLLFLKKLVPCIVQENATTCRNSQTPL